MADGRATTPDGGPHVAGPPDPDPHILNICTLDARPNSFIARVLTDTAAENALRDRPLRPSFPREPCAPAVRAVWSSVPSSVVKVLEVR